MVLACRDEKRGEQLRVALEANAQEHGNSKPQAEVMLLDVSSLQSVRSFVQRWNQQQRPLHCLINNAGIFDIGGSKPDCLVLPLRQLLLSAIPDVFKDYYQLRWYAHASLHVCALQHSITSPASMHKSGPISTSLGKAGYSDVVVCGTGQGYAKSKDGLELHMATNYLGPFLLTMLLLPSLQRSASKVGNPPAPLYHETMQPSSEQLRHHCGQASHAEMM